MATAGINRSVIASLLAVSALGVSTLAISALATSQRAAAQAPGTSTPDVASWTGISFGGHLGYATGDADWRFVSATGRVVDRDPIKGTAMGVEQSPAGRFGGAHIGASWQVWRIVLGADVAYSPTTLKDERGSPVPLGDDVNATRISNLLRTTGRVGYAWGRYHAYVNGGYAEARVETSFADTTGPRRSQGSAEFQTKHAGWTIGAGLDYRLTTHVSLGLEYAYVDLAREVHDKFVPTGSVNTGRAVDAVAPSLHAVSARLTVLLTPPGN